MEDSSRASGDVTNTSGAHSWVQVAAGTVADMWQPTPSMMTPTDAVLVAPTSSGLTWEALHAQLKWALLMHVYGFASLFFVLAFYTFFSILNLRSLISTRPFMATINGFLCLLGASRATSLFIDPYESSHTIPNSIGALLWDVGFPCVLSAFCLIELAFLQLTQLKLGPKKLRRKSFLSIVITTHFSCVIGANIAVDFHGDFLVVKYAVQGMFVLWGMLLCGTFLYGGHRLFRLVQSVPSALLACGPIDMQHKGIMQLAMLAPYNNLASSVAAALVPTLLTPKIRITDENEHTFSYASTGEGCSTSTLPDGSDVPLRSCSPVAGPSSRHDYPAATGPSSISAPRRSRRCKWQQQAQQQQQTRNPVDVEDGANHRLLQHHSSPPQADYTLHTVLNHIALMSRAAAQEDCAGANRKDQVQQVLSVTTATAVIGMILCIAELVRVIGSLHPLFLAATRLEPASIAAVWPWFWFQTICRGLELMMACAMAAVTKQPVARPPQPFASLNMRPKPTLYM